MLNPNFRTSVDDMFALIKGYVVLELLASKNRVKRRIGVKHARRILRFGSWNLWIFFHEWDLPHDSGTRFGSLSKSTDGGMAHYIGTLRVRFMLS